MFKKAGHALHELPLFCNRFRHKSWCKAKIKMKWNKHQCELKKIYKKNKNYHSLLSTHTLTFKWGKSILIKEGQKKGIWDQHPWIVSYVSLLPQEFGPWWPQLKDAANQTLALIQRGRGSREVELTVIQQQRRKKRAQTVWGWICHLQWHFLSRPPELWVNNNSLSWSCWSVWIM